MIETERLNLRPYTLNDYEAYCAMTSDLEVLRYIAPTALSAEDARNRLLKQIGHWCAFGFGLFAVFEKETGHFLGEAGLANSERELGDDFDGSPEAVWVFTRGATGNGIAFEAATAAHKWFAGSMSERRTVCIIRPENRRSLRLAERLGYKPFRQTRYKDEAVVMLERCPI